MNLANDRYMILMNTRNFTERYRRDRIGWVKSSAQGRRFRMTAEQVLNHILPALAGLKPGLTIRVRHRDGPSKSAEIAAIRAGSGREKCTPRAGPSAGLRPRTKS